MFWDQVAGVYDVFVNVINRKTHKKLKEIVSALIEPGDDVQSRHDLPQLLMRFPVDDIDKDVIHACHLIPEHLHSPSCQSR